YSYYCPGFVLGHFFMGKFILYEKARGVHQATLEFLHTRKPSRFLEDQLKRASSSVVLNIAEARGRVTRRDRRRFFIMARGSAEECLAAFDLMEDEHFINSQEAEHHRRLY